ncbi:MAG: PspC domain-containing protein [Bacteroidota bacterium]
MNKVFNINLGGYPFTIDEDAYEHLSDYLDTIHKHFKSSEGYEEITGDIEARIAELFEEHLGGRKIVTIKDVSAAIRRMGTPEDFGAEPTGDRQRYASGESAIKTGKRLFRNPEDKVVGGVCSGIAAYFGIQDPLWVRLGFILITISGGFGIPLYIILWAILSEAGTAGDRLAMRGEPINVSNIARTIEEEIDHLSDTLTDLSNDFNSKKKEMVEEIMREVPLRKGFLW